MSPDPVLALAVLAPFLAVPFILALRRRPNAREAVSLGASVATFALVASMLPAAFDGAPTEALLLPVWPGLAIALRADLLGLLFATLASFLWILTTVYSIGYVRALKEHAQTRYFACFSAVIGATMGVALSSSLFSLLVFYEALTLATYPLVIHHETDEAHRAGRKYLVYTLGGGGAVIAGMAIAYALGGNVDFVAGGNPALSAAADTSRLAVQTVAFLLVSGFGVKSTLLPLHGWLPTAMVAPTPVSGLLHAVAVVKAGVFGQIRTLFFFLGPGLTLSLGVQPLLIAVAAATILFGSVMALTQDNLKLRLAYSTISQLSYIVLGAALLTPDGLTGASFHMAAHGFAKLSMFFVAGSIAVVTGKTRVSELDGIGRRMPGTMLAFALAAVAMASLPPMAPFISKWYLSVGAWDAGQWAAVLVLVTSSVLNVAYFFPIVIRAFLAAPAEVVGTSILPEHSSEEARPALPRNEGPRPMFAPVVATVAGAVLLGVWTALPYGPFEIARRLAGAVFPGVGP